MIRVLIADDHKILREGLKQVLADTSDIIVVHEASTGHEVIENISKNEYHVVLLDISMPGRSGLEVLKEIKDINPDIHVLILSMHPEERYAIRALKAGASGYLTKNSAPDELIKAVRKVAEGNKYITHSLAERLVYEVSSESDKPLHEKLSNREYEVMCMIASGKTVTEIAVEFSLSPKTISTYRKRILDKINLKHNAEITHYVFKHGLVD